MCNFCNTSNGNVSSCGYNVGCNGSFGLWGWGRQTICRDCNGNIRVNQRNGCGCGCNGGCGCRRRCCVCNGGCGCNNGCGSDDTASNSTNGNGGFTCVTFCGNAGTAANTSANGDLYYARQYGLYPYGYNRGCGCVLDALSAD